MTVKGVVLRALAYLAITFPFAVVWHVVVFGETYEALGYFGKEPVFTLGFLAIAVQAIVLALVYPAIRGNGPRMKEALRFAFVAGLFLWSSHVVAVAAKTDLSPLGTFVLMETAYLAINFLLYGLVLGAIPEGRAAAA